MALIWADGFDHYGGVIARLRDGVYSSLEHASLVTSPARTGSRALQIWSGGNNSGARRVLPAETDNVGFGFAFNINNLPTDTTSCALGQLLAKNNDQLATICIYPTGAVAVRRGLRGGLVLAESAPEVIMPGSYQHFECAVDGDNLEIRINGVTVLNLTNLQLLWPIAQLYIGGCYGYPKSGAAMIDMTVDDLYAWDKSGSKVNTWVGDKKVYTRMPDEDGPDQDWSPSVGTEAWPILDNIPPNDDQYLSATDPGDKVSVGIAAFSSDIVSIAGVYVAARMWKTDAGNAKVSIDMVSGAEATENEPVAVSNAPRWYGKVFEEDPETLMPWTITSINNALVRLERDE